MPRTITEKDVADKVRAYLVKMAPEFGVQMSIDVLDDDIRLEDEEYWHVPVRPSEQPRKTSDYYEMLAEIEMRLLETDDLLVTLVPTFPDENPSGHD